MGKHRKHRKAKPSSSKRKEPSKRVAIAKIEHAPVVVARPARIEVERASTPTPAPAPLPTANRALVTSAVLSAVALVAGGVFWIQKQPVTSMPGTVSSSLPAPTASATATASVTATASASSALPAVPTPASAPGHFAETLDVSTFQKGNIHTHTNLSDGDHPPEFVYAWYRDHGYNFLAITDHNTLTDPARFQRLERKKRFVMIPGEEVTMRGAGKQVHVNAICTKRTVGGRLFDTQAQALTWGVEQITSQGGVALVNHPNWDWALTAADLPAAKGAALLEIASGHPYVHQSGDATHLSHEAIWDAALTAGHDLAGAAVDDAHIYGAHAPETAARPGRAWIQVFAAEPTRDLLCDAIGKGRLYASTGASLKRIVVDKTSYAVYPSDVGAKVEFIGAGGRVLQTSKAGSDGAARYELVGGEGYVRARVTNPDEAHAWTQASRVAP